MTVGKTDEGSDIVVITNGNVPLLNSEKLKEVYQKGLTSQHGTNITDQELADIINGILPNGSQIPVYTLSDLEQSKPEESDYAVIMDFDAVRSKSSRNYMPDEIAKVPLLTAVSGSLEDAQKYASQLNTLRKMSNDSTKKSGILHPLNYVNPDKPQSWLIGIFPEMYWTTGSETGLANISADWTMKGIHLYALNFSGGLIGVHKEIIDKVNAYDARKEHRGSPIRYEV